MNTTQRFATALGLMGAGAIVAVLGYLGVSRELEVAFQLPYLASAGVGALLLVGAGGSLMISTQLQRDTDRLDELEESVRLLAAEVGRLADGLDGEPDVTLNGSAPSRLRTPVV